MNWHYANAGQSVGPLTDEAFEELVRNGTIKPETLVWRAGMANWLPYRSVQSAPAAVPPAELNPAAPTTLALKVENTPSADTPIASEGGTPCCECGRTFAADQTIRYGTVTVCTNCKPAYLQKLRTSVSGGGSGGVSSSSGGTLSQQQVLARDYDVPIGDYLGRAWEMFVSRMGLNIGVTALVGLCFIAANSLPFGIGLLAGLFVNGAIMGGAWLFFIRQARGANVEVSDAFSGFGPRFWPLFLANLVQTLISWACLIPVGIIAAIAIPVFVNNAQRGGAPSAHLVVLLVIGAVLLLLTMAAMFYLTVSWIFTLPLVADKKMAFWPAMQLSRKMVGKHFWWTLLLGFVCFCLYLAGMVLCLVGLLFTIPLIAGVCAQHYQKLFGDLAEEAG